MKNRAGLFRIVVGVIGLILVVTLFSTILTGFVTLMDSATTKVDSTDNVATDVGETIGSVDLTYSLLNDLVANVASVTSTIETDDPVADNYTEPTLYLTGLAENITAGEGRTLTTTYSHSILGYFTAFDTVVAIAPVVLFLSLIFGSGYLAVSGAIKYRRR